MNDTGNKNHSSASQLPKISNIYVSDIQNDINDCRLSPDVSETEGENDEKDGAMQRDPNGSLSPIT